MDIRYQNMFVNPADFPASSDDLSVQAAVDEAKRGGMNRVVLLPKDGGAPYRFQASVKITTDVTVVLDGCVIETEAPAFVNSNAYDETTKSLHGEEHHFNIIGQKGALIRSLSNEPGIYLSNVRNFRLENVAFEGGQGLKLHFARIGRIQYLTFRNTEFGMQLSEGCNGLLVTDIDGETKRELLRFEGRETRLYGRDPDIRKSIYRRLRAKTETAPAITLEPMTVAVSYMLFRDLTDLTEDARPSIVIGTAAEEVRDISVRGVASKGGASVRTSCTIDGLFLGGIEGSITEEQENTRSYTEEDALAIELPKAAPAYDDSEFLTPNEFEGDTDAERIQKAIDEGSAKRIPVVIPRKNARTGSFLWDLDHALILRSNTTLLLLGAHLRQADFIYDNLMKLEPGAEHVTVTGTGDAMLDGGKPNGLQEKNAGKFGFGPIVDNALIRADGGSDLTFSRFTVRNTRWHAMYLRFCTHVTVESLDFCSLAYYPDMGGIQIVSGCSDVKIRDLTGLFAGDAISVTALATDGKMGDRSCDIKDIDIETLKLDPMRNFFVKIGCHDARKISGVTIDTIMDVSLAEQKMAPLACIRLGLFEGYCLSYVQPGDLSGITIRDVITRALRSIELNRALNDISIDNVHSFSGVLSALFTVGKPELHDVSASAVFFRCDQGSAYMRGTATSIITDKKKFKGTVVSVTATGEITLSHVKAGPTGCGVIFGGGGKMFLNDYSAAETGRIDKKVDEQSELIVDGTPFTA